MTAKIHTRSLIRTLSTALLLGAVLLLVAEASAAPRKPVVVIKPHGKTLRPGQSYKFRIVTKYCDKDDLEFRMLAGAVGDFDDDGEYEAPRRVRRVHEFYVEIRHKRFRHVFDRARIIVIPKDFPRPDDPVLKHFRASRTKIKAGEEVTFTWRAEKADHVVIEPGVGKQSTRGSIKVRPLATTDFTCTAVKQYWYDVDRIRITVEPGPLPPGMRKPRVKSLTVSDDRIRLGESVTIQWDTERASAVKLTSELGEQFVPRSGRVTLRPSAGGEHTISLEARNPFGVDTKSVTVRVRSGFRFQPKILAFTATPAAVPAGGAVTLTYQTEKASRVYLRGRRRRFLSQTSGQVVVFPLASRTYKLEAASFLGKTEAVVQVRVLAAPPLPPRIVYFQADPEVRFGGGPTRLSWKVLGADRVDVVGWSNPNVAAGGVTVYVAATREFVLRAVNRGGATVARVRVVVHNVQPPQIAIFSANPASVRVGEKTLLAWQVAGATQVTLIGPDGTTEVVVAAGTKEVEFAAGGDYTFRLVAAGLGGRVEATADVHVRQRRGVRIVRFDASRQRIRPGETVTLSWVTERATGVWLDKLTSLLPTTGSKTYRLLRTTTFKLIAQGFRGRKVEATLTVEVRAFGPQLPVIDEFTAMPRTVVRGRPVLFGWRTRHATTLKLGALTVSSTPIGAKSLTPLRSGEFVLTASNRWGTVARKIAIVVTEPRLADLEVIDIRRAWGNRVMFTLRNAGNAPVLKDFDIEMTINGKVTETIRYSVQYFGVMAAGQTLTLIANNSIAPANWAFVAVMLDKKNAIPESDEGNNLSRLILR